MWISTENIWNGWHVNDLLCYGHTGVSSCWFGAKFLNCGWPTRENGRCKRSFGSPAEFCQAAGWAESPLPNIPAEWLGWKPTTFLPISVQLKTSRTSPEQSRLHLVPLIDIKILHSYFLWIMTIKTLTEHFRGPLKHDVRRQIKQCFASKIVQINYTFSVKVGTGQMLRTCCSKYN
jgi:hypothetical protein